MAKYGEYEYEDKQWVEVSEIKKRIKHIDKVILDCSFEDAFRQQTIHYSDLKMLLNILEKELEAEWRLKQVRK